jgi:para-nitrobenzyl esterase
MSSAHSAELAYLFDFTVGDRPVPASSRRLADQMKRYWGSFAKDADPNDRGLPRWPDYRRTAQTLILRPTGPVLSTAVSQNHHCGFWADQPHPS